MLQDIILVTYTAVLPVVLGYIVWLLKEQKKSRDANSEGTKCLLRVKLIEYHDKYIQKGKIPSYAYKNFEEMVNAYYGLGGNGMIKQMEKEVKELPFEH